MAGFKKLIFIQIISWLLCVAAGSYFISISFDTAVSDAQKNAQTTVTKYINDLSLDDISAQNLKQSIADGNTFSSFTLRDYQGAEVFSINPPTQLPMFADFVLSNFNSVRPQFAVNDAADIKVEFVLNIEHLASQLQTSLFIVILISAILVIIPIILIISIDFGLKYESFHFPII